VWAGGIGILTSAQNVYSVGELQKNPGPVHWFGVSVVVVVVVGVVVLTPAQVAFAAKVQSRELESKSRALGHVM
jgi:hypothetical protein